MTSATEAGIPDGGTPDTIVRLLHRSRDLGFLGPGPVEDHIAHAVGFARALGEVPTTAVDLGAGGGVPGLVLLSVWPTSRWVLLDANERRTTFLREAVTTLGVEERVRVIRARAEDHGRGPARGMADLVVARAFGSPGVTAECAAPLLRVGGRLAVSEPPDAADRWPEVPLRLLGLRMDRIVDSPIRLAILELIEPCPARWPRRSGIPAKRPCF